MRFRSCNFRAVVAHRLSALIALSVTVNIVRLKLSVCIFFGFCFGCSVLFSNLIGIFILNISIDFIAVFGNVIFRVGHEGSVCAAVKAVAAVVTDEVIVFVLANIIIVCAVIDVLLSVKAGESLCNG